MLKKISGLFLGLMVLASSACVTPTHASSASQVIMTHIQASGDMGAKDEYIVLHNNSGVEVDITGWCLINKYAVQFACFEPTLQQGGVEHFYLPPYASAVIGSGENVDANAHSNDYYALIYQVTNQSSGSIVNGADTISILNEEGEGVDTKSWSNTIPTGKVLARLQIMVGPDIYASTNTDADWAIETRVPPPQSSIERRVVVDDAHPVEEEPDDTDPSTPSALLRLIITELFPNPAGSDVGKEFIELYNPNEFDAVSLDGYTLQVGVGTVKTYSFPVGVSIPPLGYVTFYNAEIDFTLVNTTGKVQLVVDGAAVGLPVEYTSPKDDYSWSVIGEAWQYTAVPTPGRVNSVLEIIEEDSQGSSSKDTPKPCASNQFRNPETGRCKLISTATSAPAPCKVNQERNPETNRCRNIVAPTAPTPCKEGQERNPETNRCRKIIEMSNAGFGVKGVQAKADAAISWYYWVAIGAVILLILGYAVWEWRQELLLAANRVRTVFAKRTD